jgi:Domain of Unknown Function (DUF1080)
MKPLALLLLAALPLLAQEATVKSPSLAPETRLFNGKDLTGWTFFSAEGEAKDAWKAKDGVLSCTGEPVGFIRTAGSHKNYTLTFEWR